MILTFGTVKRNSETNKEFWEKKISRNIERDKEVNYNLNIQGWIVLRFSADNVKYQTENCIQKIMVAIGKI